MADSDMMIIDEDRVELDEPVVHGFLVAVRSSIEHTAEDLQGILTFYLAERGALEVEVASLGQIETDGTAGDSCEKES